MPNSTDLRKIASAVLLIALTGPGTSQPVQGPKSEVANTGGIPKDTPPTAVLNTPPCLQTTAPMLGYKKFLVVNRTNVNMSCRVRHPTIGGWSPFTNVPSGGRLIDRKLDLDEIQVQCRPPAKPTAVRVFPGSRYALRTNPGTTEVALVKLVSDQ
jgi:hypothetical protein